MRSLIFLLTTVVSLALNAQTVSDAVRLSQFDVLSTARSVGVGGSMSAIGADFGTTAINPAGLGAYRASEFSFTPALFNHTNKAQLVDGGESSNNESATKFALGSLGFVFASRPRASKWTTSNFAIGINQVANFNRNLQYSGTGLGSITDQFAERAAGINPTNLTAGTSLAFATGAIYDFEDDNVYETDYQLANNSAIRRSQNIATTGANSEISFSYAANYNEKILLGFSIGVPIISLEETNTYNEEDDGDAVPFFNAIEYEQFVSTSGNGFNVKLGAIVKVTKFVGIGLAYHSRTNYTLTDNFTSSMSYDFTDANNDGVISEQIDGSFEYNYKTPPIFIGGIGAVIKRSGFISVEVQYTDFSKAEFDYTTNANGDLFAADEQAINEEISNTLGTALKIKAGGEIALNKFRARAGLALNQSAYEADDTWATTISAGTGYRGNRFYTDLAIQYASRDLEIMPYSVTSAPQPVVQNTESNLRLFLTFGFRW